MSYEYTVKAYSPTANQTIREFFLNRQQNLPVTNKQQAERAAAVFAERLNQRQYLGCTDWQPRARLEALGIDSIPGARKVSY